MIIFITASSFFNEEKIKIDQSAPSVIKSGTDFTITFKIHKTTIAGFARLQQYLPEGFSAEEIQSKGADFIFEDQSVKLIWDKLPVENDFIVSYKIKTEKNINGHQMLNGVFIYIEKGKTIRYPLSPLEITFDNLTAENKATPIITRKLLNIAPEKGEYRVELTINPNNMNESAQFTDEIPSGFIAEVVDAHSATFSFENNSAVFNWKNLPSETEFTVAYLVKSGTAGPSPVINGTFIYGDVTNDKQTPKQINVNQELTPDKANLAQKNTSPEKLIDVNNQTASINSKSIIQDSKKIFAPEKGVTFKVQISATQKSSVKNNNWFDSMYHLDSPVELTYHEGWKKYLIGSFMAYNDASQLKDKTQEKVPDAFVVAYENGIRISLKDALHSKSLNQ